MMRVAQLHGAQDMRCTDAAEPPSPGPGEALVAVRAVGVCGSDLHYWLDGRIGDQVVTEPFILGHEPAGEVLAIGPNVRTVEPGQRVAIDPALPCGRCEWCIDGNPNLCPYVRFFGTPPIDGCLRERLVHPAEALHLLPDSLSYADGALCEALGVAIHAVDLAHLKPSASIAVLGCGPIGLCVLQVALRAGARTAVVTDLVPARLEAARRLGASLALHADADDVSAQVADFTGGRGVDVVFDCATSVETPAQACALARIGGRVVLVGIPPEDDFGMHHSIARRRGLVISFARRMRAVYPRAIALVESGLVDLRALATHRFGLEQSAAAFRLVAARQDGVLKAIIEP